jgi:phage terminase small subunit
MAKIPKAKGRTDTGWQGPHPFPPSHEAFVREYCVDLCGAAAVERCGFFNCTTRTSRARKASWLLKQPGVVAAIREWKARQEARVEVKADQVLAELRRLALVDIGEAFDADGKMRPLKDMPADLRRAISAVEVEELDLGGGEVSGTVRKVKFWDKVKALELLGKHLKLFIERVEVSDVTDRAEALARARARALAGSTTAPGPGVEAP